MSDFDLVIFDCDGVLIDSEIISAHMLVAELARLGLTIDLSYVERNFLGRSYPVVMETIRREFGLDLPADFEAHYRDNLLEVFRTELRVVPHVQDVLQVMAVPFCVATSSSPRRVAFSLGLVGLSTVVAGRVYTSTMVARGKPAPDLFLFAAAKMGARPERTLVIEDSLTGIRAARAAGMEVWRFVGGSHLGEAAAKEPADAVPDLRFASFSQFFHIDPRIRDPRIRNHA
jgi:HAD superfamily hydrolase (TIGR01509 family)